MGKQYRTVDKTIIEDIPKELPKISTKMYEFTDFNRVSVEREIEETKLNIITLKEELKEVTSSYKKEKEKCSNELRTRSLYGSRFYNPNRNKTYPTYYTTCCDYYLNNEITYLKREESDIKSDIRRVKYETILLKNYLRKDELPPHYAYRGFEC